MAYKATTTAYGTTYARKRRSKRDDFQFLFNGTSLALAQSYVKGDPDVVFVWRSDDGCGSIVEFTKDSDGTVHFKCQWSSRCQNHATGVRHHILLGEVADLRPVPESRDGLDRLVLPG